MKNDNKNATITARTTVAEYEIIKKQARESGMSLSRYVVESSVNSGTNDLQLVRGIIPIIADIETLIQSEGDSPLYHTIQEELKKIWQFLR